MGNQLVAIAPSQIYPVEYYLSDFPDILYDANLGSTRFFKVARSKNKEGFIVVKVFAIPDDAKVKEIREDMILAVKFNRLRLEEIKEPLKSIPHCLPFHKCMLTEKAGFLIRQYVKDNLYDRISTRPFLNSIEKRWIAFQLLQCLNQCHQLNVCHGDIKLENIMVTSWNWVFLTDFASFKPTYLPKDNPADFSYFFDTSRRRICYIAPERFVKSLTSDALPGNAATTVDPPEDREKKSHLTPSMDVFSLGCALTELFTEGNPPFDFSQLLEYCSGGYTPWKVLDMIDDVNIRELARSMMNKDHTKRLMLSEYLEQQRNRAFPEYFYSFLEDYMKDFSTMPIMSPDEKMHRLKNDIKKIIDAIICHEKPLDWDPKADFYSEGLVVVVALVTSLVRALNHCTAKLNALDVIRTLSVYLTSDVILDRILPYLIHLTKDEDPKVRVRVIQTLTECLLHVKTLSASDGNIFPEYILPNLSPLASDAAVIVRMAYAENIVSLAETALRFLEMTQVISCDRECANANDFRHTQVSYDHELRTLQELVQQSVTILLSDHVNSVKQTILETGITRLCVFFGKQKGNDVLLSHMITYLNDKEDRHLRGAFFGAIVGVAAYVGWQCTPILKPLLQQGLTDTEEFVVAKTLRSLMDLTQLGLIRKQLLFDLVTESVPLLLHPNLWIKQGAIGFACAVARCLNLADVQCSLIPLLSSFLKHGIIQVEQELVLLNAVQNALPRCIFDYLVTLPMLRNFLDSLRARKILRSIARTSHPPVYGEVENYLKPVYTRLMSDGMDKTIEEQILAMEDHLMKIHAKKSNMDSQHSSVSNRGRIDLTLVITVSQVHSVVLSDVDNSYEKSLKIIQGKRPNKKKMSSLESPSVTMNEEWQHMFGSSDVKSPPSPKLQSQLSDASSSSTQKSGLTGSDLNIVTGHDLEGISAEVMSIDSLPQSLNSFLEHSVKPDFCVPCQEELINLIDKKQEEYARNEVLRQGCEMIFRDDKYHAKHAKMPSGLLVAHLHEHKGAINRVQHIPKSSLFATCSNDGTVKLWDCEKMEGRNIANRSRLTYSRLEGPVSCLTTCQNMQSLAAASDNGNIHVFRIASDGAKLPISTRVLDPQEERCAVDLTYFDTGSQSVLSYATLYGSIVGWDLRSPGTAWKLQSDPRFGLVTSFCIDPSHCWLVLGTANGNMICWDLRFQLCITSISHPARSCIRSLLIHPNHQSAVLASVQGNNEVSMWDIETETRLLCLWASNTPALSVTQPSEHSVHSMCWSSRDKDCSLLTGGSDMRIRYWNMNKPDASAVIANSATDSPSPTVTYRSQVIEGTEVIQEHITRPKQQNTYDPPRRYPEMPPTGHRDCISGLSLVPCNQTFVVSASRDGIVKVWK